jgi:hypothetical protein
MVKSVYAIGWFSLSFHLVQGCDLDAAEVAQDASLVAEDDVEALAVDLSESAIPSWRFPVPAWPPAIAEEGRVDDLVRVGDTIFIGGNFTRAADHAGHTATRTYLAAMDVSTGALRPFAPVLDGRVYALAASPDGATLFAGGTFTHVNGASRRRLAAFDVATGTLSPALGDLALNGAVRALASSGTELFVGGAFTSAGGASRSWLAKLVRGAGGGYSLAGWSPAAGGGDVRDIVLDSVSNRALVAGWFTSIGGSSAQKHLAALDQDSGAIRPWASHPGSPILDIAIDGGSLYAAMAGPGGTALAYRLADGTQRWYYKTDGNCQAVAVFAGHPVFGMHGDFVAPVKNAAMSEFGDSARIARRKIFMLSADGLLEPWDPGISSTDGPLGVWALRASGGTLFVGGDFTRVHGVEQERFAMFR